MTLAKAPGMSFRVEITSCGTRICVVCEGHLDAEAMGAIERGWTNAQAGGARPFIRVCRGATADRTVVAHLAGYPGDRLEVESPFLRSWLEDLRASRARAAESGNEERAGSGSEMR